MTTLECSPKMKNVIAIAGTTGVGKSNLALNIAQRLKGNIINADSIQVYKNLDIISNKPTKEELNMVEHHLFDFVENNREYSVAEYICDASNVIDRLHEKGILPVVVGGTNYYLQSLLFKSQLVATSELPGLSNKTLIAHPTIVGELKLKLHSFLVKTDPALNSEEEIESFAAQNAIHDILKTVDPDMANRWHPNDVRKIRRSLEVFYTTGTKHSLHYTEKKSELRYRTCLLWLYAKPDILNPRLDARVEEMIEKGMFEEMRILLDKVGDGTVVGTDSNYTRGILQAIGFKEFDHYFRLLKENAPEKSIEDAKKMGIEHMKLATRQYARKQVHWLKNKLSPMIIENQENNSAVIYLIDASDLTKLPSIINSATVLVQDFLDGKSPAPVDTLDFSNLKQELLNQMKIQHEWDHYECDVCIDRKTSRHKRIHGKRQWELHLKSSSHRRKMLGKQELEQNRGLIKTESAKNN